MQETQENSESTKGLILARLREYSDFPALSETIKIINQFQDAEETSVSEFANIVLKDYALTTKVLKLVNSVTFAQVGEVTTISRAISLLGMQNIKNLALTLLLFERFQKNVLNVEHMDTMLKSLYSGILAQKISEEINFADMEESYICSLFHNFGRMLVSFALLDKTEEIKYISREQGVSEDAAALMVLGGSYEEMGMAIAREWNFPEKIVLSMHKLHEMEIRGDAGDIYKLNIISYFANEISHILSTSSGKKEMDEKIGKLLIIFKSHFGMLYDRINDIIKKSFQNLSEFTFIYNVDLAEVPFNEQLLTWSGKANKFAATTKVTILEDFDTEFIKTIDIIFESEREETPEGFFAKGIQDINSAIMSNFSLNDIIRIVLETMYRGMQLSGEAKALFLIKDTKLPIMNIRFGFGNGIEELKKWFNVKLGDSNEIFNIAIMKQKDLVVENIEPPQIRKLLPEWFKAGVSGNIFFVLLPIIINLSHPFYGFKRCNSLSCTCPAFNQYDSMGFDNYPHYLFFRCKCH